MGEVSVDHGDPGSVADGVFGDTEGARNSLTLLKIRVARRDDGAGGVCAHHLTDLYGSDVGAHIVQPAPHGRIQGDVIDRHNELSVVGLVRKFTLAYIPGVLIR